MMKEDGQTSLRNYVISCRDDEPTHPDYLPTDEAVWTEETLSLADMSQCFGTQEAADWIANEISVRVQSGMCALPYIQMLAKGPMHAVVVTFNSEGKMTVCDGWHRIAAGCVREEPIRAIVGRRP